MNYELFINYINIRILFFFFLKVYLLLKKNLKSIFSTFI